MTPQEIQKEIIANRARRGWASATDFSLTILGLTEELGELENARRHSDRKNTINALADLGVYTYGFFEMLNEDAQTAIESFRKTWEYFVDMSDVVRSILVELGRLEEARVRGKRKRMSKLLAYIGVYIDNGFEIMEADTLHEIEKVVRNNKRRKGQKDH